jgi:hypothetical protein
MFLDIEELNNLVDGLTALAINDIVELEHLYEQIQSEEPYITLNESKEEIKLYGDDKKEFFKQKIHDKLNVINERRLLKNRLIFHQEIF